MTGRVDRLSPVKRQLYQRLRAGQADRAGSAMVTLRTGDGGGAAGLVLVHPVGGALLCYLPLLARLPDELAVVGFAADTPAEGLTIAELADRYRAELIARPQAGLVDRARAGLADRAQGELADACGALVDLARVEPDGRARGELTDRAPREPVAQAHGEVDQAHGELADRTHRELGDRGRVGRSAGRWVYAGWSFGGAVAYEMSRPSASPVVMLDTDPHGRDGEREPDEVTVRRWFAYDVARLNGTPEEAAPANELPDRYKVFAANARALSAYRPGRHDGPVTWVRSPRQEVESRAWLAFCRNLTAHEVPGADHYTLLSPEHVDVAAKAIVEALAGLK